MENFKFRVIAIALLIGFCLVGGVLGQTTKNQSVNTKFDFIEVEKFTMKQGVDFPTEKLDSLTKSVVDSLNNTKKFKHVGLSVEPKSDGTDKIETNENPTLKITGEIIKYDKGSQAKRYIIGMGTGKTKLIANIKFIDAQSGEVLLEQVVDGIVSWGLFGGGKDDAQNGLAKEVTKIVKTKFTDGKK